jgi:hypothetical protein
VAVAAGLCPALRLGVAGIGAAGALLLVPGFRTATFDAGDRPDG